MCPRRDRETEVAQPFQLVGEHGLRPRGKREVVQLLDEQSIKNIINLDHICDILSAVLRHVVEDRRALAVAAIVDEAKK